MKRSQHLDAVCRQGIRAFEEGRIEEASHLFQAEAIPRIQALLRELQPLIDALKRASVVEGSVSSVIDDPSRLLR